MTAIQDLKDKLTHLRLKGMAERRTGVMEQATRNNFDRLATLNRLVDMELEQRFRNATALRWKQSRLTEKLTIDQVDFDHHKSRREYKTRILHLLNLDVVRAHMDVILIGNPGAGKTFLAKSLAYAACNANLKVLCTTAIDMINHLIAAEADHSLRKKRQHYQTPDLLVGDEMGCLSLGQQGSHLFFQVISGRHQHTSTVITTTLPFAAWGKVFDATPVATAIADRLVHNSEVLILGGTRHRRKRPEQDPKPTTDWPDGQGQSRYPMVAANHSGLKRFHNHHPPDLRGRDTLDYLSLGQQGSHVFLQLISQRSPCTSTVMIAAPPLADGEKVCDSTPEAIAIADRLGHSSEVLPRGGMCYRRKLSKHQPSRTTQGVGFTIHLTP